MFAIESYLTTKLIIIINQTEILRKKNHKNAVELTREI